MFRRKAKGEPPPKCWTCLGTGREKIWLSKSGKTVQVEITCTDCRGTGERP